MTRHPFSYPIRRISLGVLTAVAAFGAGAASAGAAPVPALPHIVTVQPDTDSVLLTDYAVGTPVTVQVLRGGIVIGTSQPVTPLADTPTTTLAEFNAVGALASAGCWQAHTPDIEWGDVVRVTQGTTVEDSVVRRLTINQPTSVDATTVEFTGIASEPSGARLTPAGGFSMNLRNQDFLGTPNANGPSLRVPGGLRTIDYDATPATTWRATIGGLSLAPTDQKALVLSSATERTVSWQSGAGAGSEITEVRLGSTGGKQGLCTAELLTEGITNVVPGAFIHDSTGLTIEGIAATDVSDVSVTINDTNPFTAPIISPALPVTVAGGGAFWSMTIQRANLLALSDGQLTITPTFTAGAERIGTAKTITKNMVIPDTTAPVASITSGPAAFTRATTATFDVASDEAGTFLCKLDAATFAGCSDPAVLIGLSEGQHTFTVRARDTAGNLSAEVAHSWQVDLTRPRATTTLTVARRRC